MFEPIALLTNTLAVLKTAFETVSTLKDADKDFVEANYKVQLAEVFIKIANTMAGFAELRKALDAKDEEIKKLREKVNGGVFWSEPFYWKKESETTTGPFCQRCWDKDDRLMRVKFVGKYSAGDSWQCPDCRQSFWDRTGRVQSR